MQNYTEYAVVAIVSVGVGILFSQTVLSNNPRSEFFSNSDVRDKQELRQFTNPLLECAEAPESISIGDRVALERTIEALVTTAKRDGVISNTGIYFRDLNNGPWFGIDEDRKFYPASLLKIPLAMWYYAAADEERALLSDQITFSGPPGISRVHFPPSKTLEVGQTYTVEELIQLMLQESDNEATHILYEYLGAAKSDRVYKDLGVALNASTEGTAVDVRTYASFFRVLYNATYIGRHFSEKMLETMSHSSFTKGIVGGVPEDVVVSHKFGEAPLKTGEVQLHDCGIVYAQQSPYLLCVMSQGSEYEALADFIARVSQAVYVYVEK